MQPLTLEDLYPLHFAVWDDNTEQLDALLEQQNLDLEKRDPRDNTPLLLAYRLGRNKAARMLLAAGAFPKARTDHGTGWESIHVASWSRNPDLVRTSVLGYLRQTDSGLTDRMPDLQRRLESLPDFQCTMTWSFESWIPLLGRLLPSDTYSIFKRGSSLRLDTTLLGMTGLKWERGSVSLILWGKDMPRPGALYVADNELKTAADARLAFTHPQDTHIQDWVRKLLTQKQKITDWWSRDVVLTPCVHQGLVGGFMSKAKGLLGIDAPPRGRISDSRSTVTSASSSGASGEEGGSGESTPRIVHVENPYQVREDVGVWNDCCVYDMRNLCIRDLTAPPLMPELKLESWWVPEYSRQATQEDVDAALATGTQVAPKTMEGVASAEVATSEAPEKLLKPLQRMLRAIQAGKINENNAASATLEDLEGLNSEEQNGSVHAAAAGSHGCVDVKEWSFEEYWGVPRPRASAAQVAQAEAALAARIASCGISTETAVDMAHAPANSAYVHTDGKLHKPYGHLVQLKADALTTEDKSLDAKVYFSKDFPITTEQFLPVAEMMARTSKHAGNLRRFFETKMPAGAGFPVRFTLPIMFGITATVSFDFCDAGRPIPKSIFEIPSDFKMGAYVDRGFIRQL